MRKLGHMGYGVVMSVRPLTPEIPLKRVATPDGIRPLARPPFQTASIYRDERSVAERRFNMFFPICYNYG